MRLLFLTPGFAAHADDGTCIPPLQALARELLRQGADLQVIALEYPFRADVYPWPEPGESSATVHPCNGQNRCWLRWRTYARTRAFAKRIFLEKNVDAIHSFWLGPAWVLGERLAARWQLPHWTTLMGQDVLPQNRYLRRLEPEHTGRMIALTPFHNDQLEQSTGLRARYCIPWGLADTDVPARAPAERPLDVLGVGSLLPVKDWDRWLNVVRLAATQRPGLRAELIGNGPLELRLRARAEQLGLSGTVRFAGNLARPQVLERMRKSRVLLHTARFESFGYVLAEAAAQGCRIVSTPVGTAPALAACADTEAGLAGALLQALQAPVPEVSAGLPRMTETARAYLDLYGG